MSDEALSVDQAVAIFDGLDAAASTNPEDQNQPAAEAGAQDAQAADGEAGEPTEAPASAEDTDAPAEASEGDAEEDDEGAQPPVAMPKSWPAEDAEMWNGLPPAAQERVLARETERDTATDRALSQAAESRRSADVEAEKAVAIHHSLTQTLPIAAKVFQNKWANHTPDYWSQLARENPNEYNAQKAQHDAEQSQIQTFAKLHQEAEAIAFSRFVAEEQAKLPTLVPDLADTKEGPARRKALATFLADTGFDEGTIQRADALMISLAYDAMLYRQGKSKIAAPKPAAPAPKAVKPAAAPARSPKTEAREARDRFRNSGTVDDLVRLFDAGG